MGRTCRQVCLCVSVFARVGIWKAKVCRDWRTATNLCVRWHVCLKALYLNPLVPCPNLAMSCLACVLPTVSVGVNFGINAVDGGVCAYSEVVVR